MLLWQFLFLILGTTWLWAPHLNPGLFYRTTLISQYETPLQPFSLVFRSADVIAGCLLLYMAVTYLKIPAKHIAGWLLLILSVGLISDPIFTTTCHVVGNTCQEYVSLGFVLHAIETVVTAATFFGIAVYDSWLRRKKMSIVFAIFQVLYGLLFVSQLANQGHFNAASQYLYQTILIVWLAWFSRDYLIGKAAKIPKSKATNWTTSMSIVRYILLFTSGVETLKYSVISPDAGRMALCLISFVALFILRDYFND